NDSRTRYLREWTGSMYYPHHLAGYRVVQGGKPDEIDADRLPLRNETYGVDSLRIERGRQRLDDLSERIDDVDRDVILARQPELQVDMVGEGIWISFRQVQFARHHYGAAGSASHSGEDLPCRL